MLRCVWLVLVEKGDEFGFDRFRCCSRDLDQTLEICSDKRGSFRRTADNSDESDYIGIEN
jgi:hypothetical protein